MSKVIVITGGSEGLGKQIASDLSKDNKVIILSTTESKLKVVAEEINYDYYVCDVTNYDKIEETIKSVIEKYGKIDVLINNAGLWIQDELDKNDAKKIADVINVNLLGVINPTKAVIPIMKKHESGLIININSQAGITVREGLSIYNASKWGVTGFTKALQLELSKYGIRVTGFYPNKMKTDFFNKVGNPKPMDNGLDLEEVSKAIQYIIDTPEYIHMPEFGIKYINS